MRQTCSAKPIRRVSARAIRRAVASSTAIETGQGVAQLERKLRVGSRRFRDLELAGQ